MNREQRLERIYETVREIPEGRVASYGQVAEVAGIPRGARQVGWALRQLPESHNVPWHRVITAAGRLAFAVGSPQYRRQRALLAKENVAVVEGRIDLHRYRWQPALDELLWKPTSAWD